VTAPAQAGARRVAPDVLDEAAGIAGLSDGDAQLSAAGALLERIAELDDHELTYQRVKRILSPKLGSAPLDRCWSQTKKTRAAREVTARKTAQEQERTAKQNGGRLNARAERLAAADSAIRSGEDASGGDMCRLPVSRGVWAMFLGGNPAGPVSRGVYQLDEDPLGAGAWLPRAELPYLWAKIRRRDGSGRMRGVDYLISGTPDGPRETVTAKQVSKGEWAGMVGLRDSADPQVIQAAATAIFNMTPLDREYDGWREAVPRVSADGKVSIPVKESLPAGYCETGHLTEADALAMWAAKAIPAAVASPKLALVLGGAAISVFLGWLDYVDVRAFIIDMWCDVNGGKSTAERLAGALWGAVPKDGAGVVGSWNLSAQGPGRVLGMLSVLPAIFDEQGVSGYSLEKRGEVILGFTDGSRRAADREDGMRLTLPYSGVMLSAGNVSIAAGLGTGRFRGIGPKRVISLEGPIMASGEDCDLVKPVLRDAYGHPGQVIMRDFTGPLAAGLVETAVRLVPFPAGVVARSAAKNTHLLVAGAAILDAVFGSGTQIRDSAVKGALEYLTGVQEPEHDLGRLMAEIEESQARQPSYWPTVSEYREVRRPWTEHREHRETDLPQYGVAKDMIGVRADDGVWFAVFGKPLRDMLAAVDADHDVALKEAVRLGQLNVAPSIRRAGKFVTEVKHIGKVYRFNLPFNPCADDGQDQDEAPEEATDPTCSVCREPMIVIEDGQTTHPMCEPWPEGTNGAAARKAEREPASPAATARATASPAQAEPADANPAPACTRGIFADPAQRAWFDAACAAVDATPAGATREQLEKHANTLKLADALVGSDRRAGPFAPRRERRAPWWQPWQDDSLLSVLCTVMAIPGYAYRRDFSGPVTILDRNAAQIAATSSVQVAHGALTRTGPISEVRRYPAPGVYRVRVYPWAEPALPSPLGPAPVGGEVWIPAPTMGLLRELAMADRWPDAGALDSWTSDQACRLDGWAKLCAEVRAYGLTAYGRGTGQFEVAKKAFSQSKALMLGRLDPASAVPRREWKHFNHRTDWAQTAIAQGSATMWRTADQCGQIMRGQGQPDLGPVALRATDELVIPSASLEAATTVILPGRKSPSVRIDPTTLALGTWKIQGIEEWQS
jgi:Domain of unknown function (DUF927)